MRPASNSWPSGVSTMSTLNADIRTGSIALPLDRFPVVGERMLLKQVLEEMTRCGIGIACVVSEDDGSFVGVFTDGDLRRMLLRNQKPLPALLADDVVQHTNRHCTVVHPDDKLVDAVRVMGIRQSGPAGRGTGSPEGSPPFASCHPARSWSLRVALRTIAVIPARYASTRFPGKALAPIAGRPMVQHVWERVAQCRVLDAAVVATDDLRIAEACAGLGIDVEMTSDRHETGTDRLAEVATRRPADIYVNVQGDEPLIDPDAIDAVAQCLADAIPRGIGRLHRLHPGRDAEAGGLDIFGPPRAHARRLRAHAVPLAGPLCLPAQFREDHSCWPLRLHWPGAGGLRARPRGPVERAESIELATRYLEYGDRIACVAVRPGSIGVDRPSDVALVEAVLARQHP